MIYFLIRKHIHQLPVPRGHAALVDGLVGAFLRGEYDYASRVQLTEVVPAQYGSLRLSNVNASLGLSLQPQKLEVLFFVRNLTKNNTLIGAFPTVAQDGSYSGYLNDPRTYGVTLTKRF